MEQPPYLKKTISATGHEGITWGLHLSMQKNVL